MKGDDKVKVTVKKGKSENKQLGSAGFHDELFIDGKYISGVTGYKIEKSASNLGFDVTIKMEADVEIKEYKRLSDEEKKKQ